MDSEGGVGSSIVAGEAIERSEDAEDEVEEEFQEGGAAQAK